MRHYWLMILSIISLTTIANEQPLPPVASQVSADTLAKWQQQLTQNTPLLQQLQVLPSDKTLYVNALITQHSPYLLRHAVQPINWQPWSEQAFVLASKLNKPVFLSIGYSTCHWCHVMEKESFNDLAVATLLNQQFIAIKVDREALPEVDELYALALEQVKGSAGWPITAILDDKGQPIFIDAYLPKDKLLRLAERIATLWQTPQKSFLQQNAANLMSLVTPSSVLQGTKSWQSTEVLNKLKGLLDKKHGGFVGNEKFPSEAMLLYALAQLQRQDDPTLAALIERQLQSMLNGGLYDDVYGGFHRYTSLPDWQAPHFEKMLYTQGQLLLVYAQAAKVFNNNDYYPKLKQTVDFLTQWLYQPGEGMYSAVDAQYNDLEGGYYLYDAKTLNNLKQTERDNALMQTYPFYDGRLVSVRFDAAYSPAAEGIRRYLKSLRKDRPHIDRKVLTAWNALVIWGLAEASAQFDDSQFGELAKQLAEQIWRHFDGEKLYRSHYHGVKSGEGVLEDYAYLARAMLALFEVSDEDKWLSRAQRLADNALGRFSDATLGLGYHQQNGVLPQLMKSRDTELLSAYGVMLEVVQKLWLVSGQSQYRKARKALSAVFDGQIAKAPLNHLYGVKVRSDITAGDIADRQYFAAGKGKVNLVRLGQCHYRFDLALEPGWHINSHAPLQPYLKATKVSAQGQEIDLEYPAPYLTKLGFEKQPLSLYQGQFALPFRSEQTRVELQLQACSDKLCLAPQSLSFYLGQCQG